MSDSEKIIIFILKKKRDLGLFWIAKSKKNKTKKYFSLQSVLVRNGFPNKGLFAEVESTIKPLPLARLIKSTVAPLLLSCLP